MELQRLRQVQDDLDRKIRDLEIQHTELLRQTGSLQSQIEEKTRCVKEMEQMMNTERTRSLLEVARLKETLRKRKRKGGKVEVEEEERESTPSINATPIKVVNSPSSFIQNERKRSSSFSEKEEEEEDIKEEEGRGRGEEEEAGRRVNTSTDTSSTVLSDMLNNLSNVVNELGQQLNPS